MSWAVSVKAVTHSDEHDAVMAVAVDDLRRLVLPAVYRRAIDAAFTERTGAS